MPPASSTMREKPSAWMAKSVYTSPWPSATVDATKVSSCSTCLTSEPEPKACVGSTHRFRLHRHCPGSAASQSCGTASAALAGSRSPKASMAVGTVKVQETNSVCISHRRR